MSETTLPLPDQKTGERLRIAREAAKVTQAVAADAIGVARTTIVAIEQGQRRVRTEELQKLASTYGTSANAILRREAIHLDLVPRFRRSPENQEATTDEAVRLLNKLVSAEVELENALGISRQPNYPAERPILPGDVKAQAEQDAQDIRDWLGLGPGPVFDIVSLLSLQIGIRVYVRRLPGKISGLFAYDDAVGACILLNGAHPLDRLTQTAVHEFAHFMSTRNRPEVVTEGEIFLSREERYANSFARSFLTPARAVRQKFAEITSGQSHLTRRHIILLAHAFGVSREAMVRRLEEITLAKPSTWDWFTANGGISEDQVEAVLGASPKPQPHAQEFLGLIPPRLALLVREAWKRELYSEGQLARLLDLDRHQIREILDGIDAEIGEADDLLKLSH